MTAALKARQVAEHARSCLAIELLVAAQAIDMRLPLKAGRAVRAAHQLIRASVPPMESDRELHVDIETIQRLIDSGELMAAVYRA
jgi:histidine ammonia-lyase